MNHFSQILSLENVVLDMDVSSKKRAFEQAGLIFENNCGIARSIVSDNLFARERLGSTGLGHGVAVPHGRIKGLKAPLAAFGIHSWFQALSLRELGNEEEARVVLTGLSEFAAKQMNTEPRIDYFATSLPNLLLFEDDQVKRNLVDSVLLSALASHGLGDAKSAVQQLEEVIALDPNHYYAAELLSWIQLEAEMTLYAAEVESAP